MSGHNIIRETLLQPVIGPNGRELAMRSLDALVAENQQLRGEREWYDDQLRGLLGDFEWLLDEHPEHKGARSDARIRDIRAALAGTPSEDTE
jgi:hypothetical protein